MPNINLEKWKIGRLEGIGRLEEPPKSPLSVGLYGIMSRFHPCLHNIHNTEKDNTNNKQPDIIHIRK